MSPLVIQGAISEMHNMFFTGKSMMLVQNHPVYSQQRSSILGSGARS